jgi:nitrite reductase/ring-hydroxylating ferredoxin subunit
MALGPLPPAARYDVRTGAMTRGPQGAFKPLAGARALKTFPVVLRDGAIWLEG